MEELLNKLRESTNDLEIVELKDKIIEELSKQNLSLHIYYTGETFFSFADLDTDVTGLPVKSLLVYQPTNA